MSRPAFAPRGVTSLIESGFERKLKTRTVLVDLSAAYDTVWRDALLYKIARIIKDQSILKILSIMTGTRKFLVCSGGSESKMYKIKNTRVSVCTITV